MMLDHMIAEYGIPITAKDQKFVKALITGDPSKCRSAEIIWVMDLWLTENS